MSDELERAKANERRRVRRLQMIAALGGVGLTAAFCGVLMVKRSEGRTVTVGPILALLGLCAVVVSMVLGTHNGPDSDTIRVERSKEGYRDTVQKKRAVSMAFMPFASLFLVYQGTISAWAIAGGQGEALNWMMVALSPMMSAVHLMMVTGFDIRGDKKMKRLLEDELTLSFRRSALNAALGVALAGMVVVFALGLWKPQAAVAAMPGLMFVTASAAGLRYWQLDRRAAGG
ncbi:hypothetical protein [Brevundimonas vancanneytii]|uniref:Uncharacterized protein n=1 Tax=Brevundimonas vancanneytii TaxID=1325724 RepID=A0A4P1JV98_9CAUL|nr:hypothetical protein [Brevundimonas vancanneytii]VTO11561.1 Uncharacterised protein [Brevundimonas vancanneytii]